MTPMQRIFISFVIAGNFIALCTWFAGLGPWWLLLTLLVSAVGWYDLAKSPHTLNRLYPVAAYLRYGLEFIRPEIRQYFIASDIEERPFSREQRSLIYQRSKHARDTLPFGTQRDLMEAGYLSAAHSLLPKVVEEEFLRVTIGSPECRQPYCSSRLNISAMSFGALSPNAILALNKGAKYGGFSHNTGEGGISAYHQEGGGDLVWQIGTGYFGCRTEDGQFDSEAFKERASLEQVKMVELKLSQGAKPSHGGLLPAAKISEEIARIRGIPRNHDCVSPPTHPRFSSPEGLLEFVQELRALSEGKPIGFKLALGKKNDVMAICKAMIKTGITPDFITVDGAEGGTGAAPVEFSNRLGMPCLEATHFVHNCLVGVGLRHCIKIIAAGKTATGFEMMNKLALGADIVNAARSMMLAMGCIQSRHCNTNRCPTGIATQDPVRNRALNVEEKYIRVANFQRLTVSSCMHLIGALGYNNPDALTPKDIFRRNDNGINECYDEIYPALENGDLLKEQGPDFYLKPWQQASAESF